ncbi:MAG: ATP-dependent protease LonB [Thermoplasmata archaeon HGW-Thermoplasmata-1]|nr:MAG: ATP-dependent protease LonB [Thermoplasmata archaeon HGW-Thermoplasmata-1]
MTKDSIDNKTTAASMPDAREWIKDEKFETTADLKVPEKLLDQVIGQEKSVDVVRKAAEQKRHVMLIGDPGTGKSMIARAMTEFLSKEELEDVIAYPNAEDSNAPKIRVVPAGKGRDIVGAKRAEAMKKREQRGKTVLIICFLIAAVSIGASIYTHELTYGLMGGIAAIFIYIILGRSQMMQRNEMADVPKLLVTHDREELPPFIDATAAHSGALLGDVRHDPFQAGGLETPAHERVEAGAIHKAHRGVLYIDEINTLSLPSQQHLLTAIQDRKFQITGQSERSSGAMVKTEPVPCDFILVAAGNLDAVEGMHPALRSRIRGYGYEVYVNANMDDTEENRKKLIRFVAQEVTKDGKIPHFEKMAVAEIIHEAQRRAGRKGKLSLRLRELGGLIRVAGDLAIEEKAAIITVDHVLRAKSIARSLEQQVADRGIEHQKDYKSFKIEGSEVGMVNGLAVISADPSMSEFSGIVMPIVAEVTPAGSRSEGKIIATGKLGEIARESVQNVSAVIKKYMGKDVSNHDVHIQFIGTYEGVEGDSASISVATSVISAMENVAISQGVAMTGSLSIRGVVLPVGGVTAKIEAAARSGITKVLIPYANLNDVLIEKEYADSVEIVPVKTIKEVLENALTGKGKAELLKKLEMFHPTIVSAKMPLESEKELDRVPLKLPVKKPHAENESESAKSLTSEKQ